MTYEETLKKIFSMNRFTVNLGLERIRDILSELKDPHKTIRTIHIAGTNGKGSTASMIASILTEAGFEVGLYTSPFLYDFRESIIIGEEMISKEDVTNLYEEIASFEKDMTYFEMKTAMALTYFSRKKVDFAVIETGLGGRLDATNIISPLISVITNIGLEHKEHLGESIEEIATEKAGIIKEDTPIITMAEGEALQVIKRHAAGKKAPFIKAEVNPQKKIMLNLKGGFQQKNAYLARGVIDILKEKYEYEITEEEIGEGFMSIGLRGRFESIDGNIIMDCAHNWEAIHEIKEEIIKKNHKEVISIVSLMKDKDKKEMIHELETFSDMIIFTKMDTERGAEPEELAGYAKAENKIIRNPKDAIIFAKDKAEKGGLILITGSCYLVGETIQILEDNPQTTFK